MGIEACNFLVRFSVIDVNRGCGGCLNRAPVVKEQGRFFFFFKASVSYNFLEFCLTVFLYQIFFSLFY